MNVRALQPPRVHHAIECVTVDRTCFNVCPCYVVYAECCIRRVVTCGLVAQFQ
jgi:hypothetical protein